MLYLPCGWFHEVSSVGYHCALNFWYHPPDAQSHARPYRKAGFWRRDWQRIMREHERNAPGRKKAAGQKRAAGQKEAVGRFKAARTKATGKGHEKTAARARAPAPAEAASGSSMDAIFGYSMR